MNEIYLPLLRAIAEGATSTRTALPTLVAHFGLTAEDQAKEIPSGKRGMMFDRTDWALYDLLKAGLVDRPERGIYVASSQGLVFLKDNVGTLDRKRLAALPAFRAFELERKLRSGAIPADASDVVISSVAGDLGVSSPEERMSAVAQEWDLALRDEMLSAILGLTPKQFEQLIVDLLLKMGYGGGDRSMGERIGKSGDGGIDGIINEDALGLDAVYVQAKRYAPDSKVGRAALQAFVGSLTGEGASKGVFVTTSDFTREARDYLNKVQHRVVLINGERLARLMIQHEVGVRARQTYVLRSIDEDYFADPEA
jgi:restriction system protein